MRHNHKYNVELSSHTRFRNSPVPVATSALTNCLRAVFADLSSHIFFFFFPLLLGAMTHENFT